MTAGVIKSCQTHLLHIYNRVVTGAEARNLVDGYIKYMSIILYNHL